MNTILFTAFALAAFAVHWPVDNIQCTPSA